MKNKLKYCAVILMLIGVCILIIPSFVGIQTNQTLMIGLVCVFAGFLIYILMAKYQS